MKIRRLFLKMAAMAVALSFAVSAHADSARDQVAHAYQLLQRANRDYGGHRAVAMKELQSAGQLMHLDLSEWTIGGPEREWKSDQMMGEARRLLQDARGKLAVHDREVSADHLNRAILELDEAIQYEHRRR